jgi:hypothetical protein
VAVPDLLNRGFIISRRAAQPAGGGGRTFIVTGLHRSGTSLVAAMLQQAGLFIGSEINDIVYEDAEIARVLASRDAKALRQVIGARNANYRSWGFKQPMLCHDLRPEQLALFDDPHVIVTFRDPVAVAVRTMVSEYQEPAQSLRDTMADMNALMAFVGALQCPTLLLSYEKALTFREDFVGAIMQFCDLPQNEALRARLAGVIEPGRPQYVAGARRRYEGIVEGVQGDSLYGWCRLTHTTDPVALEVLVDGTPVLRLVADVFRQDLLDAGLGEGSHGFFVPLAELDTGADAVIGVKVAGHDVLLGNSGRRVSELLADSS